MKTLKSILKIVLIFFLIIIAIPLIGALFVKKDYHVERSTIINLPKEQVYDYVKYLRNQDKYSTWTKADPNVKVSYSGEDGSIGGKSAWIGNDKVGEGQQEIVKLDFAKRIDVKLHFIKPFEGLANAYFTFDAIEGEKTKVIWAIDGKEEYPMNFMQVFIDYDQMMGKEFKQGLENLKVILEKEKKPKE